MFERYRAYSFHILLGILLPYIVVSINLAGTEHEVLIRTTLVSLVLLAAMGCIRFKRGGTSLSRWFGLATLISGWVSINSGLPVLQIVSTGFRIVFFLIMTVALIYQVARSTEVTLGIIIGAMDGYLLLGMMGAGAFSVVEMTSPGSFTSAGSHLAHPDLLYYAYITMATVGYGDISPVAPMARSLAVLLAVAGQLYIAVLMALLVSKYVGSKQ
jgi:hypothetical protein